MIPLAGDYDSIPPQDHKVYNYTGFKGTFAMDWNITSILVKAGLPRVAI